MAHRSLVAALAAATSAATVALAAPAAVPLPLHAPLRAENITLPPFANNFTVTARACQPPFDTLPFCDTSLSIAARVADLLPRIPVERWGPLLTARHGQSGQTMDNGSIPELGIPP
jgi:hypothetical protein